MRWPAWHSQRPLASTRLQPASLHKISFDLPCLFQLQMLACPMSVTVVVKLCSHSSLEQRVLELMMHANAKFRSVAGFGQQLVSSVVRGCQPAADVPQLHPKVV